MKLWTCGCPSAQLQRVHRAPWMRLLPALRHYQCQHCGEQVLTKRQPAPLEDPDSRLFWSQTARMGDRPGPDRPARHAAPQHR